MVTKEYMLKLNSDLELIRSIDSEDLGLAVAEACDCVGSTNLDVFDSKTLIVTWRTSKDRQVREEIENAFKSITGCSFREEYRIWLKNDWEFLDSWSRNCHRPVEVDFAMDISDRIKSYLVDCNSKVRIDAFYFVLECITGYPTIADIINQHSI